MRQALERENEANRRDQMPEGDLVGAHLSFSPLYFFSTGAVIFGSFFLNISSMRCVTKNPPNALIDAITTAATPTQPPQSKAAGPAASIAPTRMIAEIAFVTDISGVCSAGVTLHTT